MRILVIDDHVDGAQALGDLLQTAGYDVYCACSGADGFALGEKTRPDLVIVDLDMPGWNGAETARRIRTAPWGEAIGIIAYTGAAALPVSRPAANRDIEYIVSKGAPPSRMLAIVAEIAKEWAVAGRLDRL